MAKNNQIEVNGIDIKSRVTNDVERKSKMKKKTGIVILFVIQALAIPLALFAGLMLMFSIASMSEMDFNQTGIVIQTAVALTTMIIGVLYIGTYIFSLLKTLKNQKLSFVSWLPILHGIVALFALVLWNYINQLYK